MPPSLIDFSSLQFLRERKTFGGMKHCCRVGFKHRCTCGIVGWSSWKMEGIYSNVDAEVSVVVVLVNNLVFFVELLASSVF